MNVDLSVVLKSTEKVSKLIMEIRRLHLLLFFVVVFNKVTCELYVKKFPTSGFRKKKVYVIWSKNKKFMRKTKSPLKLGHPVYYVYVGIFLV